MLPKIITDIIDMFFAHKHLYDRMQQPYEPRERKKETSK